MKATLAALVLVGGCAAAAEPPVEPRRIEVRQEPVAVEDPPPPRQRHPISAASPAPTSSLPTAPVDCQSQVMLGMYGREKAVPECQPGTEVESPPEGQKCYWSLARGMDGSIRAPTHECHEASPCYARVVKRVRSDGVVVEQHEGCR